MKIDIQINSRQNKEGQWIPMADIFVHEANHTRCIPREWAKGFKTKETAKQYARFNAVQYLIRNGYRKEVIFELPR